MQKLFVVNSTHFNLFYHEGKVDVTYTNDIHATKGVLPLCESQCIECETNLRVKEHRNTTCGAGPPRTLEKLKEADKVIEQSLLAFLKRKQKEGSYVRDDEEKIDLMDEFHDSPEFRKSIIDDPLYGAAYKNRLMDPLTLFILEFYIKVYLHLKTVSIGNLVNMLLTNSSLVSWSKT